MALRKSFAGIEINGAMLEAHLNAFRLFPSLALGFLVKNGIGSTQPSGEVVVDYRSWYPMDAWLKAFDAITESVGPNVVFDIGRKVPEHAQLPPDVKDVRASLRAVNVGYHLNHRRKGQVMFDLATGEVTEGIGTYGYREVPGERRVVSVCENPYPCTFDHGILTTFARKWEPAAVIAHDPQAPCRAKGATSCTYTITW